MKKAMTWLLLVLGLLLMALGSAFLYNGFGLIEIERGAALTSAGASLLAGGAVTLGLSVILMEMQQSLATFSDSSAASSLATTTTTVAAPGLPLRAADGVAGAGAAVAAGVAGLSSLASHPADVESHYGDHEVMAAPEASEPVLHAETAPLTSGPPAMPDAHEAHELSASTPPAPVGVVASAPLRSLVPVASEFQEQPTDSVSAEVVPKIRPSGPPTLVEPVQVDADHGADDWFERMFAEATPKPHFEFVPDTVASSHPPVFEAPPPTADRLAIRDEAAHPGMVAHEELVAHHLEPVQEFGPAPAPILAHEPLTPPAPPEEHASAAKVHPASDVVARHEADGITYTMFADGSIEADDGVHARRFASMEDLAASIQG